MLRFRAVATDTKRVGTTFMEQEWTNMNHGTKKGPQLCRTASGRGVGKFNGKQISFGPFDAQETKVKFAQFKAAWLARGRALPEEAGGTLTVSELSEAWTAHLETRGAVWCRNSLAKVTAALKPLLECYGQEEAASFGPKKLMMVRDCWTGLRVREL